MDVNSIIDIAFGVAVLFVGYTINRLFHNIDELWRKHDEVTQRLTKIAIEIPKEYVTKNDLNRALETIHERFDKLDTKVDSLKGE
jgi:prefoldin subunit 5